MPKLNVTSDRLAEYMGELSPEDLDKFLSMVDFAAKAVRAVHKKLGVATEAVTDSEPEEPNAD